jgi:hypothetical protein
VGNVNQIQLDELFAVGVSMTAESNHDATRIEQQTFTALYRTLQVTNHEAEGNNDNDDDHEQVGQDLQVVDDDKNEAPAPPPPYFCVYVRFNRNRNFNQGFLSKIIFFVI